MTVTKIRSSTQLIVDANLDANSKKITSLAAPVDGGDAVNKTYADGLISAANALVYKGVTDCSGNPNYPAADAGDMYMVSVGGKIGGASGIAVLVGDLFVCTTDATVTGTQASVGAYWDVIHVTGSQTVPVKATGAELDTGTDDVKFATAKALKDSHNVPSVVPGTTGNVLTSNGTDWTSAAPAVTTTFVVREVPSGTKNGSNPTFTLAHTPASGSEMVFLNGILLNSGAGNDYTISTTTITMLTTAIPVATDVLLVTYHY